MKFCFTKNEPKLHFSSYIKVWFARFGTYMIDGLMKTFLRIILLFLAWLKYSLLLGQSTGATTAKGLRYFRDGNMPKARALFMQAYRQHPKSEFLIWALKTYNLDYPAQADSAQALMKQLLSIKGMSAAERIEVLCFKANVLIDHAHSDSARLCAHQASLLNNPVVSAGPLERMARLYFMQGELNKANTLAHKALQVAQRLRQNEEITYAYLTLSQVHKALKQYDVAEHYLNQLIKRETPKKYSATIGLAYRMLGNYYADQHQNTQAVIRSMSYYQKWLQADLKADKPLSVGYHLMHLGINYALLNQVTQAKECFERAEQYIDTNNGRDYDKAAFYVAYGDFLHSTSIDTQKSIELFQKAAKMFNKIDSEHDEYRVLEALYKIFEGKRQYKQAFEYSKTYHQLREKLIDAENRKNIRDLSNKYHAAQESARVATQSRNVLAQTERTERYGLFVLIGVSCSLLIISLLVYRQLRIAKQANIAKEQALMQARRAKDAESFSYSVSHDLRTPLLKMHNQIERILSTQHLSPPLTYELKRLSQSVENTDMLVKRLLYLYSLNHDEHLPTQFEMKPLVEDVYHELVPLCKFTGRLIINDLPAVVADRMLFRQVWQNLISNAMKYSKHQAKPCLTVSHEPTDLYDVFWIADNGLGLPPGASAALFVPLKRLRRGDDVEGHGLGLAIVKRIVEQHGGEVWAEPLPQGARFGFSLPRMPNKTVAIMA